MKNLTLLLSAATVVALTLPSTTRGQTLLDLLKTIQPGQATPAQPASPPTVVTNTQTVIIYSNTPVLTAQAAPLSPPVVFDTRPAFMAFVTNSVLVTNRVIVTNYQVVTKQYVTTNFYNAQGQYLQPVQPVAPPPIPGLIPIAPVTPVVPRPPSGPDPKAVLASQQEVVKDLLTQSAVTASKKLSATGSFNDPAHQIQIPEGLTVLDRAKAARLLTAMNATAEKSIPETTQLIQTTISRLIITDPAAILKGGADAATKLLLATEAQNLSNQTLAIVKRSGVVAGLPDAYQNAMLKGGGFLGGLLGGGPTVDIDSHVTRGLLAAVIKNITDQERVIRTTPSARTTTVLQNAFK